VRTRRGRSAIAVSHRVVRSAEAVSCSTSPATTTSTVPPGNRWTSRCSAPGSSSTRAAATPGQAGSASSLIASRSQASVCAKSRATCIWELQILLLRFFRGMTQSQIAAEIGISQMHVSRLLARTLAELRTGLLTTDEATDPPDA